MTKIYRIQALSAALQILQGSQSQVAGSCAYLFAVGMIKVCAVAELHAAHDVARLDRQCYDHYSNTNNTSSIITQQATGQDGEIFDLLHCRTSKVLCRRHFHTCEGAGLPGSFGRHPRAQFGPSWTQDHRWRTHGARSSEGRSFVDCCPAASVQSVLSPAASRGKVLKDGGHACSQMQDSLYKT